jgi:hypothetical protein
MTTPPPGEHPAYQGLEFKPPCERCGQLFVYGTSNTCRTCLRQRGDSGVRVRKTRLLCDCGKPAVAVLIVSVIVDGFPNNQRLPVCLTCLHIEAETVSEYLSPRDA